MVVVKPTRKSATKKKELTRLGSALRALGGLGGSALGGLIGMPSAGSNIGTGLGASISKWLGSGDYEVAQNSIVAKTQNMSGTVPDMHKTNQSIIVRHKEFVTTINSSTGFQVQGSYDINPGNPYLFPWLSGVAARFQEYKIRGMVFHYVPTSGAAVASTNAALGAVMLQTSYRSSDTAPVSKIEMLNEYNSNESVPCEPFCHPIECDPKENPFNIQYVKSLVLPNAEDKLLYDLGVTHVAVQGCQTNGNPIGDLWVTYEVELKKPLVTSNVTQKFQTFGASYTGFDGAHLFESKIASVGTLPITTSSNTVFFPKGTVGSFQVQAWIGGGFTSFSWGAATLTNCSLVTGVPGVSDLRTTKTGVADSVGTVSNSVWMQILDPSLAASVTFATPSLTPGVLGGVWLCVSLSNPFA